MVNALLSVRFVIELHRREEKTESNKLPLIRSRILQYLQINVLVRLPRISSICIREENPTICHPWLENINLSFLIYRQAFDNIYRMLRPGGNMLILMVASHDIYDVFKTMVNDSRYASYIPVNIIIPLAVIVLKFFSCNLLLLLSFRRMR